MSTRDYSPFAQGLPPGPDPQIVVHPSSQWALAVSEGFLVDLGPFPLLLSWFMEKLCCLLFRPQVVHFGF